MEHQGKPAAEEIVERLYRMLADLHDPADVRAFLVDLCTPRETEQMAQRMECAKLLMEGETYTEIIARTDISSTTLSRVSRCLQHGSGGYATLLADFLAREKGEGETK